MYLGTPEMAVPPLRALHAAGFDIALVVSRPDAKRVVGAARWRPARSRRPRSSSVCRSSDGVDDVLAVGADLGVVVAFGRIIKPHVLDALAMVNLHFSLLPRWRGAAPVERAILAGDERTGVCVMAVEEGLDTGGIYAERPVAIGPDETADELRGQLVDDRQPALLVDTLRGRPRRARAPGRRAHLRREDRPGRAPPRLVRVRPSSCDRIVRLGGGVDHVPRPTPQDPRRHGRCPSRRPVDRPELAPGQIDAPVRRHRTRR